MSGRYINTTKSSTSGTSHQPTESRYELSYQRLWTYDPTLFGHPHKTAAPQATEPFCDQYPEWANPDKPLYYHPGLGWFESPLYVDYTMDGRPLIIGYGKRAEFSRNLANGTSRKQQQGVSPIARRPVTHVDVHTPTEFLQTEPLLLLVRFSTLAAAEFPNPRGVLDNKTLRYDTDKVHEDGLRTRAEDGDGAVDIGVLGAEVCDPALVTNAPIVVNGSSNSAAPDSEVPVIESSKHGMQSSEGSNCAPKKKLVLGLAGVERSPNRLALLECLKWMHNNKNIRNKQPLKVFLVPNADNIPLTTLVELYAAALTFGLRPSPTALRRTIMNRLSEHRPQQEDMQVIWELLPKDDSVLTRMVTAYYEHEEEESYSDEEIKAIFAYSGAIPDLDQRFIDVHEAREVYRYRKMRNRKESEGRAANEPAVDQRGWERINGRIDGLEIKDDTCEGQAQNLGRRRLRRQQPNGDKGKGSFSPITGAGNQPADAPP